MPLLLHLLHLLLLFLVLLISVPGQRACQLRDNEVHDWITRGCIAIELRLLVRHGVGGRGWRPHLHSANFSPLSHPFSSLLTRFASLPSFLYLPPGFIPRGLRLPRKVYEQNEHPINQQSETIWSPRCYLRLFLDAHAEAAGPRDEKDVRGWIGGPAR